MIKTAGKGLFLSDFYLVLGLCVLLIDDMTMNSLCTGHNVESTPTRNEPHHEKTNNVVSEQVRHKPSCGST